MDQDLALRIFTPHENIIFDFGGIFVDLDFSKTADAFNRLGVAGDFSQFFSKAGQTQLFNQFEVGAISSSEFLSGLRKFLNLPKVSDEALIDAWGALLLDIQHERVEFLKEIGKSKKVFLLSNINQLHEEWMDRYLLQNPQFKDFYSHFDKVYFSHRIGLRKPHSEIFEFVCQDSGLDKNKTLFIDDSIQHVEGARKFGLHAHHLDPSNSFIIKSMK